MAKDPAFLFYPGDWLGGTMGMSFEEKGAYLELLVLQWNCHRITNDTAKRLVGEDLWHRIAHKFESDGSGFFNNRLETEKTKRKKHSEKQSLNANKRWNNSNATALPLENENINGNENKELVSKRVQPEWEGIKKKWMQDFRWKESFCSGKGINIPELETLMGDFLLNNIELKEDYKTIPGLKSHFVNWFNKHHVNGSKTHQPNSTGSGGKLGTSDARVNALKNW